MRNIKEIVSQLTLEEKAGLCSGQDFWHTKAIERLGIPSLMLSDGPHGLRKQDQSADHLGINDSIKAVCFPAACATAGAFDRNLLQQMGETLGNECQAEDVSVILGPGVNIKRSPLCGRNFEYFSEDPYLTGELATAFVKGVQSQGIGTSPKHFAANNQEYRRMSISSQVGQQALREIYLSAFETIVKEAQPKTIMSSYNRLNGVYTSQNEWLLTDILRKEWGFEGYVVSDWGAVDDRVKSLEAGLELEMPSSNGINDTKLVEAVRAGLLEESILDLAVERLLTVTFDDIDHRRAVTWNKEADHAVARQIAEESAVLLKNSGILPLSASQKIAFIGEFAKKPRFQGGGSSHINSFKVTNALDEANKETKIIYAQGYDVTEQTDDVKLRTEAVEVAQNVDVAVLFIGLPDSYESEGYDRTHMSLPQNQTDLVEAVTAVQPHTIVVLYNGSVVELPWADKVAAILEMYLAGQAVGEATVNLLFGHVNPSGRLAETFPLKLEHNPSYLNFPGNGRDVDYQEGIFVGYRYYDTKNLPVAYPFGHGLSYTTFTYSDLKVSKDTLTESDNLEVSVTVTNSGTCCGKEVVQLYVSNQNANHKRPIRELKAFDKIDLAPGESQKVTLNLTPRSFAYFSEELNDWYIASGIYNIQVCRSSREVICETEVRINSSQALPFKVHRNTTIGELLEQPNCQSITKDLMKRIAASFGDHNEESESSAVSDEMATQMMSSMPLRALLSFGILTDDSLEETLIALNTVVE
ncbi:glycoside hydrolase family 3 C-terminal domain-containing protein [Streptococcus sp. S784/96/1]|uniref:glycoside hydrolase family 3 C-terminal domain-containing protein n=1 Tax=Streptococcus sp. S784/96/1 TaxID=2653499 RepID=UPI00192F0AAF|nr:glycoside hydrolase family 3 C-terminal domain-containing protein [Streptococcus sp. S784/96/1]